MNFSYIRQINKRLKQNSHVLHKTRVSYTWSDQGRQTPRPTHLQVHSPGHDQRSNEQVGHSQADHQVVGGGLEGTLPQHSQTHQHIPKHNGEDEQRVEHSIVVPLSLFLPGCPWAVVPLVPSEEVWLVPDPLCAAKCRHGDVLVTWEGRFCRPTRGKVLPNYQTFPSFRFSCK